MSEPTEDTESTGVVSIHPLFPNFGEFIDSEYWYTKLIFYRVAACIIELNFMTTFSCSE